MISQSTQIIVTWIEQEEDHPAWHQVFTVLLLESLRYKFNYWYNFINNDLKSGQNIAATLLNTLNLPPCYYRVTVMAFISNSGSPEYI